MPNGGVPRLQVIWPADSDLVLISEFASLRIARSEDYEDRGVASRPALELTEAQALALTKHLSYWFEQRSPMDLRPEPGTVLRDY